VKKINKGQTRNFFYTSHW